MKSIPYDSWKLKVNFFLRTGAPQPDNHEGVAEGPISTEFDIGITIEGLQEYHDEACLAVLNNKYNDDIAWHDVACHYRLETFECVIMMNEIRKQ